MTQFMKLSGLQLGKSGLTTLELMAVAVNLKY